MKLINVGSEKEAHTGVVEDTTHSSGRTPILLRNLAQLRHGRKFGLESSESIKRNRRHLTAAELRCLTIGAELINRAGLVFLDDPFYNLKWQEAERVSVTCARSFYAFIY